MSIERIDLPDGQWVDVHTVPTDDQMRDIERGVRRAATTDAPDSAIVEACILVLVAAWHVTGSDGSEAGLRRGAMGQVPRVTLSLINDHLQAVIAATNPGGGARQVITTMLGLSRTLSGDRRARMVALVAETAEVLGVTLPNVPRTDA